MSSNLNDAVVLTVSEAAEFLRVSESIIRRLIKERRIPYFQIEGRYLLYRPVLESWIRGLTTPVNGTQKETPGIVANEIWEKVKKS